MHVKNKKVFDHGLQNRKVLSLQSKTVLWQSQHFSWQTPSNAVKHTGYYGWLVNGGLMEEGSEFAKEQQIQVKPSPPYTKAWTVMQISYGVVPKFPLYLGCILKSQLLLTLPSMHIFYTRLKKCTINEKVFSCNSYELAASLTNLFTSCMQCCKFTWIATKNVFF